MRVKEMINLRKQWKKLMIVCNVIDVIAVLVFYPLIPRILNYPPNSINNAFQIAINGLTYTQQYILIVILCELIENIVLLITYKKISKNLKEMESANYNNIEKMYIMVERKIEITPIIVYLLQVVVPVLVIILTFGVLNGSFIVIAKVSLVFFAMFLSIATISYTFSKTIYKDILVSLFYKINKNKKIDKKLFDKIKRTSIKESVIFVVIPIIIITIVLITFIGYGAITKQNGDLLYEIYNEQLDSKIDKQYYTIDGLKSDLLKIEFYNDSDSYYIIYPNGKIYTSLNNEISEFFIKYSEEISKTQEQHNRTYGFYATDEQGVFTKVNLNGETYIVGVKYSTASTQMLGMVLIVSIILIIVSIILLIYSLNYIFIDIELVTNKLNKMAKAKKIDLNDQLPISSNNEISDLVKSFTNVQEKTNKYIEQIEQDKYTMERQAQFSILGEFAGGLAHDLNSPLGALKLDISTLRKYINSDKISAQENIKNKLNEMLGNIDSSLNSMSNTIIGVRNQIRATGDTQSEEFLLIDIIEGIKILFRSIFMKNNCQLEVNIPSDLKIYGERNKLDRVIGNLIKNSIDAYAEKKINGVVTVGAEKNEMNTIIYVSDKAGGIDKDIQDKIFKEIRTTKKENGTGFGLYYSNTIIESSYKGKMYFKTEQNVGTTFYIELPNKKEEK